MEQKETNWEENGCLCSSCLRFFDPTEVLLRWSARVAMGDVYSPGCRPIMSSIGKYICRTCSEQNRREFEQQQEAEMLRRRRRAEGET